MNLGVGNFDFSAPVMRALLELRPACIRIEALWQQHEYEPGKWRFPFRDVIARLAAAGIEVMILLGRSTPWASSAPASVTDPAARCYWPPADPAAWLHYVDQIIRFYPEVEALEVWNEPNDATPFWPGGRDPRGYARLLWLTREHVKATAPHIRIIAGGTAGIDVKWYRDLKAEGIEPDEIAVHSYLFRQTRGDKANDGEIKKLAEIRKLFKLPIRLTEVGWRGRPDSAANQTTAVKGLRSMVSSLTQKAPYVSAAYLFTFNWSWSQKRQGTGYGMLDPAGNKLPLFDAFRELVK